MEILRGLLNFTRVFKKQKKIQGSSLKILKSFVLKNGINLSFLQFWLDITLKKLIMEIITNRQLERIKLSKSIKIIKRFVAFELFRLKKTNTSLFFFAILVRWFH